MAHLPRLDGQTCIDCGSPTFCGSAHGGDHDHSRQARECTTAALGKPTNRLVCTACGVWRSIWEAEQSRCLRCEGAAAKVETCVTCDQPSTELDGWTQRCPPCDENARFDRG